MRPAVTPSVLLSTTAPTGVGVHGTSLTLNGVNHRFTGVNAYELGTMWGQNFGCGGMESDQQLSDLFASLPKGSLVRVWALQGSIGTNYQTHQLDWAPLDRVMNAAASHGQYVILSLGDIGGTCDNDHWAQPDWYAGGFRSVYDDNGRTPMSYWSYMQSAVSHFRSSPALAMWEPFNEAEASTCAAGYSGANCMGHVTCPSEATAATDLRYFFDTVGARIKALDPRHLVEEGLLSSGQCGAQGADWQYLGQSPGLDVLSAHDYYGNTGGMGGDQWNGIALRLSQATSAGKPLLVGEMGDLAASGSGTGCLTVGDRATAMQTKIATDFAGGVAGVLPWNWETDTTTGCSYNVNPGDPLLGVLGTFG